MKEKRWRESTMKIRDGAQQCPHDSNGAPQWRPRQRWRMVERVNNAKRKGESKWRKRKK